MLFDKQRKIPSAPTAQSPTDSAFEKLISEEIEKFNKGDERNGPINRRSYCTLLSLAAACILLSIVIGLLLGFGNFRRDNNNGFTSAPGFPSEQTFLPTFSPTTYPTNTDGSSSCDEVELFTEFRSDGAYISLIFTECPGPELFNAFVKAAERWSQIIKENKITPSILEAKNHCARSSSFHFDNNGDLLDHLVVYAEMMDSDGVGGRIAYSIPCFFDSVSKFPILGSIVLDRADLSQMKKEGTLETKVLQQFAHVLGFGYSWEFMIQGGAGGIRKTFPPYQILLQDPIYRLIFNEDGIQIGLDTEFENKPFFVGSEALKQYRNLGGTSERGIYLEDGSEIPRLIMIGIVDRYWSSHELEDELLVYKIKPSINYKLSVITIASLEDIGYSVDYTKADSYSIPKKRVRGT